MISLLMIVVLDFKQKTRLLWRDFRATSAHEWIRKIKYFDLVNMPVWKVNLVKGLMTEPWFDPSEQMNISAALSTIAIWIKAVIKMWDALMAHFVSV